MGTKQKRDDRQTYTIGNRVISLFTLLPRPFFTFFQINMVVWLHRNLHRILMPFHPNKRPHAEIVAIKLYLYNMTLRWKITTAISLLTGYALVLMAYTQRPAKQQPNQQLQAAVHIVLPFGSLDHTPPASFELRVVPPAISCNSIKPSAGLIADTDLNYRLTYPEDKLYLQSYKLHRAGFLTPAIIFPFHYFW